MSYSEIPVTYKGDTLYAKIDTDLYNALSAYKWFLLVTQSDISYVATTINSHTEYLHRLVMNAPKGMVVDHINHDTLNNTRRNLRVVTQSINCLNRVGAAKHNKSSGIRGVSWNSRKHKWEASVHRNRKKKFLGYFDNVNAAEKAVIENLKEGATNEIK